MLALNWTNTDDRWILTAGSDNCARIWDTRTGRLVLVLEKHKDTIQQAIFSPDDSKVVTIGTDKQLIVWDIIHNENSNDV